MKETKLSNKPKNNSLNQQRLPGIYPIMTPCKVIIVCFSLSVLLTSFGNIALVVNYRLYSFSKLYRDDNNVFNFTIKKDIATNLYIYYSLSAFYQNHQRFLSSMDFSALNGTSKYPCEKIDLNNNRACFIFNDTFRVENESGDEIFIGRENLVFPLDRVWFCFNV
jgi:hypothetical protein